MTEEQKDNVVDFPTPSVANSMDDIRDASSIEYKQIKGFKPGQTLWIGSITAGDIIEWTESVDDKEKKRTMGLRLISKSLVSVEPTTGKPGPTSVRYADNAESLEIFRQKNHRDAEAIVKEILDLNGMNPKADAAAKKD